MKVKELISQLQKLDPTGEVEVFAPSGDIYFLQKMDWYWDGRPGKLVRDSKRKPFYDVIGMHQVTAEDRQKIVMHCMDLDDVISNTETDEEFARLDLRGDERFMGLVKKSKEENDKINRSIDFDTFKKFVLTQLTKDYPHGDDRDWQKEIEFFFNDNETLLRRRFRMGMANAGGSINDQKNRYYRDCVRLTGRRWPEPVMEYITGFEEKNYNAPKNENHNPTSGPSD